MSSLATVTGISPIAVNISIASPCVVTWTAHNLVPGQGVMFFTTGALPTGISALTEYFVMAGGYTPTSFQISATIGGIAINTSGSQSGVQSAVAVLTTLPNLNDPTAIPVAGLINEVSVTPTVTAGSYSTGFVWGGVITLSNILNQLSFDGELISLALKFKASIQTLAFDVAIFNASPSGTYNDHATPTWSAADATKLEGIYSLAIANNDFGAMSVYNLDNIGKAISSTSSSLFAVVVGKSASTNNPGSTTDMILTAATIL
jgi:hypothetical protein